MSPAAEHVPTLGILYAGRQALADDHRATGDTPEVRLVLLLSALIDRAEAMLDAAPLGMSAETAESFLAGGLTGYTEAVGYAARLLDTRGET